MARKTDKPPKKTKEPPAIEDEEVTEIEQVSKEEVPEEAEKEADSVAAERDEYKDKFLRTYADLENFRKRVVKEKEDILQFGNEKLLVEVLQIKDDLDRATLHQETADLETLKEGLALIGRDLKKILTQFKVETIDAVGKPFDPKFHEAMAEEASEQHPPGTVLSQLQNGYLYHGRLLRPARVVVAKKPAPKT